MFLRLTLPGQRRLTITLAQVEEVVGVNSLIAEDSHILLWDFDNTPYHEVYDSLQHVQARDSLPDIELFKSRSDAENYHAYCFKLLPWKIAVGIIATTPLVDWNFLKWGMVRGKMTLRIGPKGSSIPHQVAMIPGSVKADLGWQDLPSFVNYETLRKNHGR